MSSSSLCSFCSQHVQPRDDGTCPRCGQRVFVPREPDIAASALPDASELSGDPLAFLASEEPTFRAGKMADEIMAKESEEPTFLQRALFSPHHALVDLLINTKLGRILAFSVALLAMVFAVLMWSGVLGR